MKTISQYQLVDRLRMINHATPITISALVDSRARKTNNPYGEILKLSKVNGMTGFDYENSVNRQLGREGKAKTFEASERSWGRRISPALVEKDNSFYIIIKIEKSFRPVFMARIEKLLKVIPKEKIEAFLPVYRKPANQGTEKEVIYRNYSLANLKYAAFGGEQYRIRGD